MYGKPCTRDQLRKHIVELKTGNPEKGVEPESVTSIAKRLGISRETVYQYLKEAKSKQEVTTDSNGKIEVNQHLQAQKDFKAFSSSHPITEDEVVKTWISASKTMGHTGNGVKSMKAHIQGLQKACNFLKISPIQFTIDFETSEKYAQAYYDALESGEIPRKQIRKKSSALGAFYQVRQAIRHFMQYNKRNSIAIPRGYKGILKGKIIGHGNYADVDASDREHDEVEKYIIERYGLDSDIYRIYFVGLESCARKEALLNMELEWTEDTGDDNNTTFFMVARESKTEHIGEGKLDKFIQRPNTQESLRLAKRRGQKHLWDSDKYSRTKIYELLSEQLRDIYKMLGKTNHYFYEEPFHTLRHLGAHYHLRKTDYNYGFVAVLGGWTVIDELKNSYGKMPPSILMRLMKKTRRIEIGNY